VRGIGGDRVFDRLPIGEVFLRIAVIVQVSELGGSDGDAAAFALADVCAESVGFITSLMRGLGVPQLKIGVAQPVISYSQIGIVPQSLMERRRGFDPDIR